MHRDLTIVHAIVLVGMATAGVDRKLAYLSYETSIIPT